MKRVLAVFAGLLLAAFATQAVAAVPTIDKVKKNKALVVGVRDSAPPFGFLNKDKKIVGVEIDLAAAVAKKLGVPMKLVPLKASQRIEALLDGKVDLVAATFSRTEDRAKVVDFTLSYFRSRQRILAKKGAVATLKDLDGKKVAVIRGTTSELGLRDRAPAAVPVPVADLPAALAALQKGEADAVTGDGVPLYMNLETLPKDQFEVAKDVILGDEVYAMAVRKGDAAFLDLVNGVLKDLAATGEAKNIVTKWFPKDLPAGVAPPSKPAVANVVAPPAPKPAPAPKVEKFGGVITRKTGAAGRYVAISYRGTFRQDAKVDIYNMDGEKIAPGTVHSIYGDEIYVDATGDRAGEIGVGFPVGAGFTQKEAKDLIASRKDAIQGVKAEAKKEEEQRQKEIAADWKKDQEKREAWQEKMTEKKMEYDYAYDDSYWGGSGGGYYYYGW